jgi:pimeloyl-ACP methyl ester carboxylesterase
MKYVIFWILIPILYGIGVDVHAQEVREKTFVLVHGAWAGEWSWEPVAEILRENGNIVYNISLTGQGQRQDEHSPTITLEDHINDVLAVLEKHDLKKVYLVPHSYGGKVATGAWDRARSRIHHVIYIDAFAPVRKGEAVFFPSETVSKFLADNPGAPKTALVPFPMPSAPIAAKTVPMPLGTIGGTVRLSEPLPESTLKSYVLAGNNNGSIFQRRYFPAIVDDEGWTTYVLPTGHFMMGEMPEVLAAILQNAK